MAEEDTIEPVYDPEMAAWFDGIEAVDRYYKSIGENDTLRAYRCQIRCEVRGKRFVVLDQLKFRFGMLPPAALAYVKAATSLELDGMVRRVLTAATLDEVLGQLGDQAS